MKKILNLVVTSVLAMTLLSGCLNLQLGGGSKHEVQKATTGQQLIDLQKAKEAGAISDAEYETQRAKVLNEK